MGLKLLTHAAQVAAHLRCELLRGVWSGVMPGVLTLEAELGVNRNTMQAALRVLESEGLLVPAGNGRPRRIQLPENFAPPTLRVKILLYEHTDRRWHIILDLQHQLLDAGHSVSVASKTLLDLGMDVGRVERFVGQTDADAWVVASGSRAVLEWFAAQPVPALALFGRRRNMSIAGIGPEKNPTLQLVVRRLVELGHKRIVMLMREEQTKPQPGANGRAFLGELAAHGLPVGDYNLPEWQNTPNGFLGCLDALFKLTPPTALIIDEAFLFNVAQQHLARRGILAPEHVSLVSADADPSFEWFRPTIAHIHWDSQPVARRVLDWANNVACGKDDRRNVFLKTRFIEGGTIGPVPRRKPRRGGS